MSPIAFAIPVFMLSILAELWFARRRATDIYETADAITSLHFGILSQVAGAFTLLINFGIYSLVHEHARLFSLSADTLWVWIFALLFYDFCYYWVHRAGHEVNLLWAAHQVHHSSEYYNLTTALRQTATGAFTSWPFYIIMAIVGIPPIVFGTVALIDLLYQYWVHTRLVPKLGALDRIFVTPSNHRVHHGQNDYCIDRNYGGIFIFWDRLFGSFAEERDGEPIVYGIRTPLASFNPIWGNFNVYRDIWQKSRAAPTLRAALRVWFEPPAGPTRKPAPLDPNFKRHQSPAGSAERRYVLLQYALLVLPATHFIAMARQLELLDRVGYAAVIVLWVWGVSRVLDGRRHCRELESVRVVVTALVWLFANQWFGLDMAFEWRLVFATALVAPLLLLYRPAGPRGQAQSA